MKNIILILTLLFFTTVKAEQISVIKKGQQASYDGFLIDAPMEKKMRGYREKSKLLENKNEVLKQLGELDQDRINLAKGDARNAKRELTKSQVKTVLYFVLGIVAGGAAVYVGSKVSK